MCHSTISATTDRTALDRVRGTTTVVQLLTGQTIGDTSGTVRCLGCGSTLGVGDIISAIGVRPAGAVEWTVPRLYCWGCAPATIRSPTCGMAEVCVFGRIGLRVDPTTREQRCCLSELSVRAFSPPDAA
jgi:hypothetical protein